MREATSTQKKEKKRHRGGCRFAVAPTAPTSQRRPECVLAATHRRMGGPLSPATDDARLLCASPVPFETARPVIASGSGAGSASTAFPIAVVFPSRVWCRPYGSMGTTWRTATNGVGLACSLGNLDGGPPPAGQHEISALTTHRCRAKEPRIIVMTAALSAARTAATVCESQFRIYAECARVTAWQKVFVEAYF